MEYKRLATKIRRIVAVMMVCTLTLVLCTGCAKKTSEDPDSQLVDRKSVV